MISMDAGSRTAMRQGLERHFSESELRTLCFDMGIDYDSLGGAGRGDRARELVAYSERRGTLGPLLARCALLRPHGGWPTLDEAPADQAAALPYRFVSGRVEILLVRTSGGRWLFPKGNVGRGERSSEVAEKEALEEAGVRGTLHRPALLHFRHMKKRGKRRVALRVALFLLQVEDEQSPRHDWREPTWHSPEAAREALALKRDRLQAEELARVVREAAALLAELAP